MRDELEKLVAAGKIQNRQIEPLLALVQAGFCQHKSWGFGRITALDAALGRLNIDFVTKPGHSMDLVFSAESLKAIPPDHILVRKHTDLAGLKQEAALHHLAVVKVVLRSYGGRASADQIMAALVPDVISSDWKKWWEIARGEMKRDGHFTVPAKKTDAILFTDAEIGIGDRLGGEFKTARGLKNKLTAVAEMLKSVDDIRDKQMLNDVLATLNNDIRSHLHTQTSLALEAIFLRDDLRAAASLTAPAPDELGAKDIWALSPRLVEFFGELATPKHRRGLESFRDHNPEWPSYLVLMLNQVPAKLAGECSRLLLVENKGPLLKETLAKLISQHGASSELLLWLGKERGDHFADILGPELFRAMLSAMERDAFNERKSTRLHDFILDDQELVQELIASADVEVVRDLTRNLQLSPVFDDMDKRSLLARIVRVYPQVQSMITGGDKKEDHTLLVSWASLERRKSEYQRLVEKDIPANIKDIALARSYGDLRENHEYKSAKETQKVLNRRKGEIERELSRARGTDFANPRTDTVSPGTKVSVTDLLTGKTDTYSLVGAWDGDPDNNRLSYLTPLAQSLLYKPVGTEVEFGEQPSKRRLRIDTITAG